MLNLENKPLFILGHICVTNPILQGKSPIFDRSNHRSNSLYSLHQRGAPRGVGNEITTSSNSEVQGRRPGCCINDMYCRNIYMMHITHANFNKSLFCRNTKCQNVILEIGL